MRGNLARFTGPGWCGWTAFASAMAAGKMMYTPPPPEAEEAENVASVSIMVQLLMLGTTFIIGHVLRRNKILIVHEAGAALLLGALVGLLVTFVGEAKGFRDWIDFNNRFFFYFLLPPIIFESGWSLKTKPFFDNFGAICIFAFGGTLLSTFGVGILVWIFGAINLTYKMPFMVCLTFGALISATDPVTVLAIFNELGADENLYAYVFGESVLNDAVAIVMYKTVLSFITHPGSGRGIFGAFWFFVVIFIGSFSIGVLVSLASALLFKYGGFQERELGILESCLVVLFPYLAYMMADAMELSGIVSILFAGITMKYYTAPNLSKQAKEITTQFFLMLAKLSETFVFVYMGVAMFLEKQSWDNIGFTFFTIISILLARVMNVYPCAHLVNYLREPARHIPPAHQHALWYSGLRGAMAFALSLQSVTDLPDGHGRVLLTSTLFTIFFTVLLIGGTTSNMLNYLEIECHGPSGHEQEGEALESSQSLDHSQPQAPQESPRDEDPQDLDYEDVPGQLTMLSNQKNLLKKKLNQLKADTSFASLDKKYLKPFFAANAPGDQDLESPPPGYGTDATKPAEMQPMQKRPGSYERQQPADTPQPGTSRKHSDPIQQRNWSRTEPSVARVPEKYVERDQNVRKIPERYDTSESYQPRPPDRYQNPAVDIQARNRDKNPRSAPEHYDRSESYQPRPPDKYKNPAGDIQASSRDKNPQKAPEKHTSPAADMQTGPEERYSWKEQETQPGRVGIGPEEEEAEAAETTERRSLLAGPAERGSLNATAARLKQALSKKTWTMGGK